MKRKIFKFVICMFFLLGTMGCQKQSKEIDNLEKTKTNKISTTKKENAVQEVLVKYKGKEYSMPMSVKAF